MRRILEDIRAVVGRIIFWGLSVQIILGLLWMCSSFCNELILGPGFAESFHYLRASEELLCDEYTGILYPFLLWFVRGVTGFFGIAYGKVIFTLQLAAALAAGYCLVESLGVRGILRKIWGSLALLTFPMAMLCHMSILPNSLAYSAFLLLLSCVIKAVKGRGYVKFDKLLIIHGFWALSALLMPEYLFLGAVPVIALFLYLGKKFWGIAGRKILYHFLLLTLSAGMLVCVSDLTQKEGAYGRVHASAEAAWFLRTSWTSFAPYYHMWPEEIKAGISEDEFSLTEKNPENMAVLFQPKVEEILGVEAAKQWFGEFGMLSFQNNYPNIIREMVWDAAGYVFPTVVFQANLEGRGYSSMSLRNYEAMRQSAPELTKYYMDYGIWWLPVGVILAGVMQLLCLGSYIGKKGKREKFPVFGAVVCMLSAGVMVAWYSMQGAGLWDYKDALFASSLWVIWMVCMAERARAI